MMMQKRKNRDHNADLMATLHFTAEDLEANQNGELSHIQHIWLNERIAYGRKWARRLVYAALLVISLALVVAAVFATLLLSTLFIILPGLLIAFLYQRQNAAALRAGLKRYEGIVTLDLQRTVNTSEPYILVGETRLQIPQAAFSLFKNGEPYEVYVVGKQLVSAYWLNEPPFDETMPDENAKDDPELTESEADEQATKSRDRKT